MNEDENIELEKEVKEKESICPRCGLRSYDEICLNCGTSLVDRSDDEEEEYDWREKYR